VKGTEIKETRLILGHPKCDQLNKRIVRTHKQIQKSQVKTSELRMMLVGLKYEEFKNRNNIEEVIPEDDCYVAILKG
jgi:hypothetical protein